MATKFVQTSYKTKKSTPQKLTITSTGATLSTVLPDHIETVRFVSNVDYWLTYGSSTVTASSTAGGGSIYMPAYVPEYKNIDRNSFISVRANGSSGFVCISAETQ